MASGKTNAEQVKEAYFGQASPKGAAAIDHILLERSETNKVLHDGHQARVVQAWLLLYAGRVAWDNRTPYWKTVEDPILKEKKPEKYIKDNWHWMYDLYSNAMDEQLTLLGYSREQFLKHAVAVANMGEQPSENKGFWDIFKGGP